VVSVFPVSIAMQPPPFVFHVDISASSRAVSSVPLSKKPKDDAVGQLIAVVLNVPLIVRLVPLGCVTVWLPVGLNATPPRFASAPAAVVAPVPPFTVETGPERARVTFPLEPPPAKPEPAVTAVMLLELPLVVTPGNVWPGAKVIRPLGAMARPVGAGSAAPDPKSRERLAEGLAVLLAELCACQTKFCGTAALLALEYELAPNCKAGEFMPPARLAAEANRLTAPRKVLAPFTSNIVAGVFVPIPTLIPDSAMIELPRVAAAVHTGR